MIRDVLACGLTYLPRGACYLLTTLYRVAPEDRKLTMNWENGGGLWKTGGGGLKISSKGITNRRKHGRETKRRKTEDILGELFEEVDGGECLERERGTNGGIVKSW